MHFDSEVTYSGCEENAQGKLRGQGKGVMGVKRAVEESFVCFIQKVERMSGEKGVGVEVEVVVDGALKVTE